GTGIRARTAIAASARGHGYLMDRLDDHLAPRFAMAGVGIRDPRAAVEPRTVEIGVPTDADALTVRKLVDVRAPGLLRVRRAERLVELEADEQRPRRLQHDAAI